MKAFQPETRTKEQILEAIREAGVDMTPAGDKSPEVLDWCRDNLTAEEWNQHYSRRIIPT